MKCQDCSERLSEYIDGRLPADEAAEVAAHVEACAECRTLLSELRQTVALVSGLERAAVPADLAENIAARLERHLLLAEPEITKKRRILSVWRFTGVGAAAAAMLLAALYVCMTPPNAAIQKVTEELAPANVPVSAAAPEAPAGEAEAANRAQLDNSARSRGTVDSLASVPAAGAPASAPSATLGIAENTYGMAEAKRESVSGGARGLGLERAGGSVDRDAAAGEPAAEPSGVAFQAKAEKDMAGTELAKATPAGPQVPAAGIAVSDVDKLKALGYVEGQPHGTDAGAASLGSAVTAAEPDLEKQRIGGGFAAGKLVVAGDLARKEAKEDAQPRVFTYYFEGKVTAAAMEFLKLLPDGKEPLPAGDVSLEELKGVAAARKVTVVELTADKAVFDYVAAPETSAKLDAALSANRAFARKGAVEKRNIELAAKKSAGEAKIADSVDQPHAFLAYDTAGKAGSAMTRIVFLRRPAATPVPAVPAEPAAPAAR